MPREFKRLCFYDLETSGLESCYDQIVQFAGFAVDENLDYIPGDELEFEVRLRDDVVPSPQAFAVTGISPVRLQASGITEFEAAGLMQNWFAAVPAPGSNKPGNTCIGGFNSLRFDDEFTRQTFYRNGLDAYEHEWRNNNGRIDVMRVAIMAFGLRPETLTWPTNEEGRVSMKLGDLTAANGIKLENAHNARSDIVATLELLRLIKSRNPRLWDYYLTLTDKSAVKKMVEKRQPLVLVDTYLPREQGHMSMILPVIYDKKNPQKMLCVNLREDPTELLSLTSEEIRRRVFTPTSELGAEESLSSMLRDITVNKQPLVVEPSILRNRDDLLERAQLDLQACYQHAKKIQDDEGFRKRLEQAYEMEQGVTPDPYEGLYSSGFWSRDEQLLRARTRQTKPINSILAPAIVQTDPFEISKGSADKLRMFELTLRCKWGNFTDLVLDNGSYTGEEMHEWVNHLNARWNGPAPRKMCVNIEGFREALNEVRSHELNPKQAQALEELEAHVDKVIARTEHMKRHALSVSKEQEDGKRPGSVTQSRSRSDEAELSL
jgi:exodeoxyribonuclease-1